MLTLTVGNTSTTVDGRIDPVVYKALKNALGYRPEDAEFMQKNMNFEWDGIVTTVCYKGKCKCPIYKEGTHFPSALLARAWEVFDQFKVEYQMADARTACPMSDRYLFSSDKPLRVYQQTVVDDAVKRGRGIVKMATGGGKTVVAAALIARLGVAPFIFYVPSIDLLEQAHKELTLMIRNKDGSPVKIGRVGGGYREIEEITVMTVPSAVRALDPGRFVVKDKDGKPKKKKNGEFQKKKVKLFVGDDADDEVGQEEDDLGEYYAKVKDLIVHCKGMICDETHHWAAETCQLIADWSLSCRYRFGFSATPWRDKNDDILIDACFGKQIADINASFLIDQGFLVPPTIYFVPCKNMAGKRFADYAEGYELGIARNEWRNQQIAKMAKALADQGRQVLILIKHIAHGELLEEMIPGSVFLHGKRTKKQRREHLDLMRERKAPITIASVIFDEGIDVRPQDALILGGGGKSMTRALQRVGRVIRPYALGTYVKQNAVVIDFRDIMKWMEDHFKARRKIYRSEPRFVLKELVLD